MLLLLLLKEKGQGKTLVGQVVQAVLVATLILLQVVKIFFFFFCLCLVNICCCMFLVKTVFATVFMLNCHLRVTG